MAPTIAFFFKLRKFKKLDLTNQLLLFPGHLFWPLRPLSDNYLSVDTFKFIFSSITLVPLLDFWKFKHDLFLPQHLMMRFRFFFLSLDAFFFVP